LNSHKINQPLKGPIVRIRPDVLHINDPEFIDKLYTRAPGIRREKYKTTLDVLGAPGAILGTKDHDLHRSRRITLNPFFSMQNVRRLEPVIQQTLLSLFSRLEKWAQTGVPAPMNVAFKATTQDIISEYAFGPHEKALDMDDLNEGFYNIIAAVRTNHLGTYIPLVIESMSRMPPALIMMIMPRIVWFVRFLQVGSIGWMTL
jgi:cytochrome P450